VRLLEQQLANVQRLLQTKQEESYRLWLQLTEQRAQTAREHELAAKSEAHLAQLRGERERAALLQASRLTLMTRQHEAEVAALAQRKDQAEQERALALARTRAEEEQAVAALEGLTRQMRELRARSREERARLLSKLSQAEAALPPPPPPPPE
jgi:hypothetical protein